MANNYFTMTGVLVLNKVTPIIRALFDPFALDENTGGEGKAYIAEIAEVNSCTWDDVLENLLKYCKEHDLKLDNDDPESQADCMEDVLNILADHFGAIGN